jgi:hypothetical protein
LYDYNFWYDHSVLEAVRYAGQDGTVVAVWYSGQDGTVPSWQFRLDLHNGQSLTQSDYTRSCINTTVLMRMST